MLHDRLCHWVLRSFIGFIHSNPFYTHSEPPFPHTQNPLPGILKLPPPYSLPSPAHSAPSHLTHNPHPKPSPSLGAHPHSEPPHSEPALSPPLLLDVHSLQADDYHLDRQLFFACRNDREALCSGTQAGEGKVYKCLMENQANPKMSQQVSLVTTAHCCPALPLNEQQICLKHS